MTFRIGQRVIFISYGDGYDQKKWDRYPECPRPVVGRIYVVMNAHFKFGTQFIDVGLQWSYRKDLFRPVVDRPTDISIFTKMLNPNKESVS